MSRINAMPRTVARVAAPDTRRIAPGPLPESGSTTTERPSRLPSRRIGVNVACEACRRRKIRCSGSRPKCLSCTQKGINCHYTSTNPTETNSAVLKRQVREAKKESGDFEEFYKAIQNMPATDSRAVFRMMRQGADIRNVARQIREGSLRLQLSLAPETRRRYDFPFIKAMPTALLTSSNSYLKSPIYEAVFHDQNQEQLSQTLGSNGRTALSLYVYSQPYHSAEIVNAQLSAVDLLRWTTVTDDNELMRTLLHSYFLHEYSSYTIFHKDIFIQALTEGDERFCSSLLVNALLAEAAHCYMGIQNREQFWDPGNIGYQFLAEAKRLWELQTKSTDLPTLQAAVIIHVIYVNNGIDKPGLIYLNRAIAIAEYLQLFHGNSHVHDKTMRHARDFTAWCLYNYDTMVNYYYFTYPTIPNPPLSALPNPASNPSWYGDFILKYPTSNTFTSLYFPHFFNAISRLRILLHTIATLLFRPDNREKLLPSNVKLDLRLQMESWLAHLPVPLHPSNIVFPSQLKLHMEYHAAFLALLRTPVRNNESSISSGSYNKYEKESLQEDVSIAMIQLETIFRIYYLRHSFEFCDTYLTFFLSTIGFAALAELRSSTSYHDRFDHLMSTIVLCVKGLYDQGQHVHVASTVYRLLRGRLSSQDLSFLQRYVHWNLTDDNELLITQHIQSQWPLPIAERERDPEAATLENLAKQYNEMSMSREKK
ncbi:hypothetical protein V8C35DRAFT_311950 [Trichoderma chlorosporum]